MLLVILIFLMVTTTYQRVAELQITLPEADADAVEAAAEGDQRRRRRAGPLRDRQDVFTFTRRRRSPTRCARAAGDAKDPVVIINADANATHQSVIHVMEAARLAGLVHITFATQSTPSGRRGAPRAAK